MTIDELIRGVVDVKTAVFSKNKPMHIRHSLYHSYLSAKGKRKEMKDAFCPHCNIQMKEHNDNVLGVNFDGSYYIKRAITTHLCNQCNYLQR